MLMKSERSIALMLGVLAAVSVFSFARAGGPAGIELEVTVGSDLAPDACAGSASIDALVGDRVNLCYRVTNHAAVPLAYQSIDDSVEGPVASEQNLVIAPGATVQYNRIKQLSAQQGGERTITWTARDARPDYTPTPRAGAFIDLSVRPTATALNPPSDASDPTGAGMVAVNVPFSFSFYGVPANQLCVGTDGAALVGLASCILFPTANGAGPLPQPGMGTAMLPLWDDFAGNLCGDPCIGDWGTVYVDTVGDAPNRQFVVEWYNLRHEIGGQNEDRATFEIVIDEADGRIAFEYADVEYTAYANYFGAPDICNGGVCASIGLQQDDNWATSYAYLENAVTDGSAIDWIPNTPATYTAQASVTLNIGKPVLSMPSTLTGSAVPGGQASVSLTLANSGDRDLHWSIDAGTRASASTGSIDGYELPAYVSRMLIADYPTMNNTLLGFDVDDPQSNAPVGSIQRIYDAGTFIDDDFSAEYLVNGWHYRGASIIFTTEVLDRVDTSTAEITTIGDTGVGPFEQIQGLAWDPTNSVLYGAITAVDGSGTTLASIDRYSAEVTRLMPLTGIDLPMLVGLAIDSTGRMFSIEQNSASLVEIDKTTGVITTIGPLGDESALLLAGPLAVDRTNDVLYMTGATADLLGGVYYIDTTTGHASLQDTIGADPQLASAFAIASAGGACANPSVPAWLVYDPNTGIVAAGAQESIAVGLDATALSEGTYEADLCVRSDDPYRHSLPVHITFEVSNAADRIFANGFDI